MWILDNAGIIAGVILAIIINYLIEMHLAYQKKNWITTAVFIHPETGTSYEIKKRIRNGKIKSYINGFRVPNSWVIKKGGS